MRAQYPNQYNQLQQMMRNNSPEALLRNMLGGKSPEQRRSFYDFAKKFGYSDDQINQIENLLSS